MDNDVLHKTTAYGLFANVLKTPQLQDETYGALGAAKYVVSKKLKKRPPSRGLDAALADLSEAFQKLKVIEPTQEEIATAAGIEYQAQHLDLALDTGESMLCAVLLVRGLNHVLTGDKRAIKALEILNTAENIFESKIICLEQIFLWLVSDQGIHQIRNAVCNDKAMDQALTSCFSCYSPEVPDDECVEGLRSYILDLKRSAPVVLVSDD